MGDNLFDPRKGLIVVAAEVHGPLGIAVLRLALDTGATTTVISHGMLVAVGLDPSTSSDRQQVTTGSGVEFAPRVVVRTLTAIGAQREYFPVLAHTLPPSAGVDGLLGLDFLRGTLLTIDFRTGRVALN